MKVLVERHGNIPSSLLGKQECPYCFSELLVEEGDIINATFAPLVYRFRVDENVGMQGCYDDYDFDNLYEAETFLCPVCNHYIVKKFDEKSRDYVLIALLDKIVNGELCKNKEKVPVNNDSLQEKFEKIVAELTARSIRAEKALYIAAKDEIDSLYNVKTMPKYEYNGKIEEYMFDLFCRADKEILKEIQE